MLGRYNIVHAYEYDAEILLRDIHPDIKKELDILSNLNTLDLIKENIQTADDAWSVFEGEQILCIFGVGQRTLLSDTGIPWMLTTTYIKQHTRNLLIGTKVVLDYWMKRYNKLENFVPSTFTSSIRWLKWAGFTIEPSTANIYRVVLERG